MATPFRATEDAILPWGDGGAQERDIAARYRNYARVLADEWPRTARLMTHVAEGYESDGRREDLRAKLRESTDE
jgi:hypothetical protein